MESTPILRQEITESIIRQESKNTQDVINTGINTILTSNDESCSVVNNAIQESTSHITSIVNTQYKSIDTTIKSCRDAINKSETVLTDGIDKVHVLTEQVNSNMTTMFNHVNNHIDEVTINSIESLDRVINKEICRLQDYDDDLADEIKKEINMLTCNVNSVSEYLNKQTDIINNMYDKIKTLSKKEKDAVVKTIQEHVDGLIKDNNTHIDNIKKYGESVSNNFKVQIDKINKYLDKLEDTIKDQIQVYNEKNDQHITISNDNNDKLFGRVSYLEGVIKDRFTQFEDKVKELVDENIMVSVSKLQGIQLSNNDKYQLVYDKILDVEKSSSKTDTLLDSIQKHINDISHNIDKLHKNQVTDKLVHQCSGKTDFSKFIDELHKDRQQLIKDIKCEPKCEFKHTKPQDNKDIKKLIKDLHEETLTLHKENQYVHKENQKLHKDIDTLSHNVSDLSKTIKSLEIKINTNNKTKVETPKRVTTKKVKQPVVKQSVVELNVEPKVEEKKSIFRRLFKK